MASDGGNHVRNGLAFSAAVHRLFVEGLVTFGYAGGHVHLTASPTTVTR